MVKEYKATKTFNGVISMAEGQTKKMDSASIHVRDLLRAKLIEEVKVEKPKTKKKK